MKTSEERKKLSEKTISLMENIVFISAIVIVIVLFTVPIIVYYISDSNGPNIINSSTDNESYIKNNTELNCFSLSWGQQMGSKKCFKYSGVVCRNFFAQCTRDDRNIGIITDSQTNKETTVVAFNNILKNYQKCQQVALPFLCQYYFPLVDCSTGVTYTASREDCNFIETGVCADLWTLAIRFRYDTYLPDCSTLPYISNSSSALNDVSPSSTSINDTSDFICREDFIKIDVICEPRCDTFEQNSYTDTQIIIYADIIASIIALILSILAIILSIKERHKMFTYPSILNFIQVMDTTVVGMNLPLPTLSMAMSYAALIVIIGATDRSRLYCSSPSLLETLDNPTPFCKLTGALSYYSIMNMVLLWFSNIIIFFHKVLFPFQAHRLEVMGRNKYILAITVILCTLLPLPAVFVSFSVDRFKYNMNRFPSYLCISSSTWFYSATLPIDILLATGVCMLIIILWYIRKKPSLFRKANSTSLSVAEKKIILVFISVSIFGFFNLGYTSDITAKAGKFKSALTHYFTCEAFGHIPGKCDREKFETMFSPYVSGTASILLGLVPLSILNFIFKWSSVKSAKQTFKRNMKKHLKKGSSIESSETAPTSSV